MILIWMLSIFKEREIVFGRMPMKRYMTVFLALTLIFSCVSVVNASAINEVTPEEIQIAVSDYVEDWVQDTYSNHYDMSDFEVSFFSTTIKIGRAHV